MLTFSVVLTTSADCYKLNVYVCVCVCICVYMYMYVYIYVCLYIYNIIYNIYIIYYIYLSIFVKFYFTKRAVAAIPSMNSKIKEQMQLKHSFKLTVFFQNNCSKEIS